MEGSAAAVAHGNAKHQHLYKVLVCGDYAVGKTSLIRRYCHGEFTSNYRITIGVDFCVKSIDYDEDTTVSLQLWDIAGHERFGPMTRVYYKFAIAAVIVFDISRPSTLENVKKWKDDINEKVMLPNGKPIPMLLLANKSDMPDITVDADNLDKFARENGFCAWFQTSAKTNLNVDKAFFTLVDNIVTISRELNLAQMHKQAQEAYRSDGHINVLDASGPPAGDANRTNDTAQNGPRRVNSANSYFRCCG